MCRVSALEDVVQSFNAVTEALQQIHVVKIGKACVSIMRYRKTRPLSEVWKVAFKDLEHSNEGFSTRKKVFIWIAMEKIPNDGDDARGIVVMMSRIITGQVGE